MGTERTGARSGRAGAGGGAVGADLPDDAVRTLAMVSRVVERALDGMTLPQFRILALVARAPERASRLAAEAAVSRPSLTGVLDGLEATGWVRRGEVDGDRRGVALAVTPAGRRALDDANAAVAARLGEVLGHVDEAARQQCLEGLAALGEAIRLDFAARHAVPATDRA
jgi:DNA-binding MarR family transcriptional regulator